MNTPKLTVERLRELLHYDPETGVFVWRVNRGRLAKAGAVAGSPTTKGYVGIKVEGVRMFAHRLAIFYMTGAWPPEQVDHRDRQKTNNRYSNLRPSNNALNQQNRVSAKADSKTGVLGVSWNKQHQKFTASLGVNGKYRQKRFLTIAEAEAWYLAEKRKHHPGYHCSAAA